MFWDVLGTYLPLVVGVVVIYILKKTTIHSTPLHSTPPTLTLINFPGGFVLRIRNKNTPKSAALMLQSPFSGWWFQTFLEFSPLFGEDSYFD